MQTIWLKKMLSAALSLTMCAGLMAPALTGSVAAAETVKIACVGDSITYGAEASRDEFNYPSQLQKLLGGGYYVQNFGESGNTLLKNGNQPYLLRDIYPRSQAAQANYYIIMLGTNDSKPDNWKHKDEFASDMREMITTYRNLDSHPTVIVATSPTVGADAFGISDEVVTNEVIPIQKQVAADMGCPIIDINALTKGAPQNFSDGVHPNDTGYALMAKMFYDSLQDIFHARVQRFAVNGMDAAIDDETGTISLTLPHGTDLTALKPEIALADGAAIDKTGSQDFSKPVTYTVTSPDGKEQKDYTVTLRTQDPIKVACVGDSITIGVTGSTYVTSLQSELGDGFEVRNFGNSGKTLLKDGTDDETKTEKQGYILTKEYKDSIAFEPDIVTIMLGTNDSKPINWDKLGEFFEGELRDMVQVYQDLPSHPTVYIATSPIAFTDNARISEANIHNEIAPLQRKVADDLGCPLIEVHDATHAIWNIGKTVDGIHPNEEGSKELADVFAGAIRQVVTTLGGLTLNGAVGVIDNEANTVTVTLPAAADVMALEPVLALPAGCSYTPTGPQNFTKPVAYTVTAAGGKATRTYTVSVKKLDTVKVALVGDDMMVSDKPFKALTCFLDTGYEIGRFGVNGATAQKTGKQNDGQNAAYTDQPQYEQSLAFQPDIVLLSLGTNDSKLAESGGVANWTADSSKAYETDLRTLIASYQTLDSHPRVVLGTSSIGAANKSAQADIINKQIAPIQRSVAADMGCFLADCNALAQTVGNLFESNELFANSNNRGFYQLIAQYFVAIQDAQAAITGFTVNGVSGILNQTDKTIYVSVPDGTDLTALTPAITLTDGAQSDRRGPQNFGQSLPYTVTAANGWTSVYTVSVTSPSGVTVAKLDVQSTPTKTAYKLGEKLDTTGGVIAAVYTDGSRETVAVTPDMVVGYDWLASGRQTLTVTYGGKSVPFYAVQVYPYGILGSFAGSGGKYRALWDGYTIMHFGWLGADKSPQFPINLDGHDLADLSLEIDIAFGSDQEDIDPSTLWQKLDIKLRSPFTPDENYYAWTLLPSQFEDAGTIHISIPLSTSGWGTGKIDWSKVQEIQIQGHLSEPYWENTLIHYMDVQNVYIVDNTQKPAAPNTDDLKTALNEAADVDADRYTGAPGERFHWAMTQAQSYLTNPYALPADVDQAAAELRAAITLNQTLAVAETRQTDGKVYTADTAAALANAIALSEALTNASTQTDMQTVTEMINTAIAELQYIRGDVAGDGTISIVDALMALQAAAGKITLTDTQKLAANVDGVGRVTANDALLILKYATKQIQQFPPHENTPVIPPEDDGNGLENDNGVVDTLP